MRLTLRLLGFEVFSLSDESDEAVECGCSLDGGTTASYPVGFTQPPAAPFDHDCPHQIEWE